MSDRTSRYLFALLLIFCAIFARGSTTTLTGNFTDAQGNPLNGRLVMQLPVPAMDTTTNTAVMNTPVYFRVVNGAITGGAALYDVANLQPQGLFYSARAYDTTGAPVFSGNYVVTGATFNLGAAIPTSVTTSNISYAGVAFLNYANTGNLTLGGYLLANQIRQPAANTFAGFCIMAAGACPAVVFPSAYLNTPACTVTWSGDGVLTGTLFSERGTTGITPTSTVNTDTAHVDWMCVGNPN